MKKKKLVLLSAAAMLSLAVAGSIGATVASAETTLEPGSASSTTTVTYQVDSTWEVTIPDSIELHADGSETTASVSASGVKIEQGQKLTVTVESENEWKVQDSGKTNGFDYQVTKDGTSLDNSSNNTVLEVEAGTASGSQELKAKLTDATDAGKYSTGEEAYTDTLTFTVTVA